MAEQDAKPSGPDLTQGVALTDLADGSMLVGHVGDERGAAGAARRRGVRRRRALHPLSRAARRRAARRRHRALPVASRLLQPAHRRGAARAGASAPLDCWSVEQRDGKIFVAREARGASQAARPAERQARRDKIVIVGGGAAGLRRRRDAAARAAIEGSIVMLSNDDAAAGRPAEPVEGLSRRHRARGLDPAAPRRLLCRERHRPAAQGGRRGIDAAARARSCSRTAASVSYDRLLLATGAEPVRLPIPGADLPHVHTLRSLADSRAIIEQRRGGQARRGHRRELHRARGRGLAAHARPRGPCRGAGEAADGAHPRRRRSATSCARCTRSTASSSTSRTRSRRSTAGKRRRSRAAGTLEADLVVVGVGVRPRLDARREGRARDRSRRRRRTPSSRRARRASSPRATSRAGPIRTAARRIRVEHWVVAERQGQTAAAEHARARARRSPPCRSSGASTTTCRSTMSATPRSGTRSRSTATSPAKDCLVRYKLDGRTLAVASIYRDVESLKAEAGDGAAGGVIGGPASRLAVIPSAAPDLCCRLKGPSLRSV